ncbi:MAG: hypothetical protein LBL52_01085 [Rickettsiales bacterium]|jgi:hypothetical protein|nr:hypothetical protein [Rickettsiales bacterium]
MFNGKIDLVYLWVDSADRRWLSRKNQHLQHYGELDIQATAKGRWFSNDELRYSLRSVEKYLPWINHIFIVTDEQVPKWLDTANPRVSIVDHKAIIPAEYLPLYNSAAIEMFLANIPDLAEHFLYANDDMFVNAPLDSSYFFEPDGTPIVDVVQKRWRRNLFERGDYERALAGRKHQFERWLAQTSRELWRAYGIKTMYQPVHQIEPMRKSYLADNVANPKLAPMFEKIRRARFRMEESVQRIIFPLLDRMKGRTKLRVEKKLSLAQKLVRLFVPRRARNLVVSDRRRAEEITVLRPFLFCINDDENTTDLRRKENKAFLARHFPTPSQFEIKEQ